MTADFELLRAVETSKLCIASDLTVFPRRT